MVEDLSVGKSLMDNTMDDIDEKGNYRADENYEVVSMFADSGLRIKADSFAFFLDLYYC